MRSSLGERPARSRQKEIRHQRIYDAALELIRERGFHGFTMNDVAARSEVARATVFNHYRNKDGLLIACHANMTAEVLDDLDPTSGKSGLENILTLMRRFCDWATSEPELSRAIISRIFLSPELAARDRLDEDVVSEWLVAALRHARAQGEFEHHAEPLAAILLAVLSSTAIDWASERCEGSLWARLEPQLSYLFDTASRKANEDTFGRC